MATTFTISQTPGSANLYLYPNASTSTQLTRYPAGGTNYSKVDEAWTAPNDDTDYVYTTNIAAQYDYYGLPNHTTESGTINYVAVVARAKSALYTQSSSGTFKLGIQDGTYTTKKSWGNNNTPLTTSYNKYYSVFTSSPSSAAWTWAAIDKLNIAIQCSSPSSTTAAQLVLYPNGAGGATNIDSVFGAVTHWEAVDESAYDDDTTYIYTTNTSYETDRYTVPNHTSETGTINSVTQYLRVKAVGSFNMYYKFVISDGVTDRITGEYTRTPISTYTTYSYDWTTAPDTTSWDWTDIDNLELGISTRAGTATTAKCTQCYAVVNYNAYVNPQIRTTQCYAVVNYTPSTTTVTLSMPETVNVSHGRDIQRFTFPAGDYEISDFGRSNKTLTFTGTQTSSADTNMQSIKNMCHYGKYVTIAGLPDTNMNTDYMIQNINWSEEAGHGTTRIYKWTLTLEEY